MKKNYRQDAKRYDIIRRMLTDESIFQQLQKICPMPRTPEDMDKAIDEILRRPRC